MKKLLQLSALFLVVVCFGQTPIHRFKFNGNLASTDNANVVLTAAGNTGAAATNYALDRTNIANYALSATNTTLSTTISNLPTGANARSISFWFKNQNTNFAHVPFSQGANTTSNAFAIQIQSNQTVLFAGGASNVLDINEPAALNQWKHYVATYNGTQMELFIDGVSRGTRIAALNTTNSPFRIGLGPNENPSDNSFSIDDVNIYNTALTATQVNALFRTNDGQALYPTTAGIPTNGLVFGNQFTNGTTVDASATGAVINTNSTLNTALDSQGTANNARSFDLNNTIVYEIKNYSELRVGTVLPNREFSVSMQVRVDATYLNNLAIGQYITFFNHGGVFLRYLKLNSGFTLQAGYQDTNGVFPIMSPLNNLSAQEISNSFITVTLTNGANGIFVYVNNISASASNGSVAVAYNTIPKMTLGISGVSNQSFKGILDNVFIYNRQISASEVAAIVTTNTTLSNQNFNTNNLKFSMYPNPANDILNISMEKELVLAEIYSLQGQKVLSGNEKQINISNLSSGMYMVRVTAIDGAVATQKLVKQ